MTRFTPLWQQAGTYAAAVDRRLLGALWPTPSGTGGAVTPGASGGMAVDAAPGMVAIPTSNNTGSQLCAWDAPETVTLDPSPPSGTDRVDLVIVQARAADVDGGANNDFVLAFVKGADGGGAPAVPPNAVALAQVTVPGGAAAIVAGNIADARPGSTLAAGIPLWVPRGLIAHIWGPPTQLTNVVEALALNAVPVRAGRRYRVAGGLNCVTNAVAALRYILAVRNQPAGNNTGITLVWGANAAGFGGQLISGGGLQGAWGEWVYVPAVNGTVDFVITNTGNNNVIINPNSAHISVEDLGAPGAPTT